MLTERLTLLRKLEAVEDTARSEPPPKQLQNGKSILQPFVSGEKIINE